MNAPVKYQLEAYSAKYRDVYRVDIGEVGYTGAIRRKYIGAGGISLTKSEGVIQPSILSMNIKSDFNFEFLGFFQYDNNKYPVCLYKNNAPVWSGFVVPESYQEPYINPPYDVNVTAIDCLALLENHTFPEISGYISRLDAIRECLKFTGLGLDFCIAIDLFSKNMDETRAMLSQLYFLAEIYSGEPCSNVIQQLLPFNTVLTQHENRWLIRRPFDDSEKTHLVYDAEGNYIGTTPGETMLSMGAYSKQGIWPHGEALLTMNHAISEVTFQKDFGKKKSFFKNYDFSKRLTNWDNQTKTDVITAEINSTAFCRIKNPTTEIENTCFLSQSIPVVLKTRSDFHFKIRFDSIARMVATEYLVAISGAPRTVVMSLCMQGNTQTYWLDTTGWKTDPCKIEMDIVSSVSFPDWKELEIIVGEIPETGTLTVELYRIQVEGGGSPRNDDKRGDACFTDIYVFTDELEEIAGTETITVPVRENATGGAINEIIKPVDLPEIPNAPLYFLNGNYTKSGDEFIPTLFWQNNGGDWVRYIEILSNQYISFFGQPLQSLSGCVWRGAGLSLNSIARHPYNFERVFVATTGTWDILNDVFNLTWVEKPASFIEALNKWIVWDGIWGDSGRIWIDEDTWKDTNENLVVIEVSSIPLNRQIEISLYTTFSVSDTVLSLPLGHENIFGNQLWDNSVKITETPYVLTTSNLIFEVSLFSNQSFQTDWQMIVGGFSKTIQLKITI